MHIAIITWGDNSERAISLISAAAVQKWLEALWYTSLSQYDFPTQSIQFVQDHKKQTIDFVFLIIHGTWGEDGQIASYLDLLRIPYQCTSTDILALTINKRHTKLVWRAYGLPVADDIIVIPDEHTRDEIIEHIQITIWFPCVRKEFDQWSSRWVHIINNENDIEVVRKNYSSSKKPILIEQFIQGEEITIPVLDNKNGEPIILPHIRIIPPQEGWFDYENKYNWMTQEICPHSFDKETDQQIADVALQAYQAVWCTKYGRIDAIVTEKWPILLEINTIPWFTSQSLFPKSALVYWLPFPQLLKHLIDISMTKYSK